MNHHFNSVKIENFKSIKELKFDCKRINIFLGEPNVGKSNILEALSLFSAPLSFSNHKYDEKGSTIYFGWDQIRYSNLRNLFFFQDTSKDISITTDIAVSLLRLPLPQYENYEFYIASDWNIVHAFEKTETERPLAKNAQDFYAKSLPDHLSNFYLGIHKDGSYQLGNAPPNINAYQGWVKKYSFNETLFKRDFKNKFPGFLLSSYGSNVFTIVQGNHSLADLVAGFFEKYDLEFIFISENTEYVIQRKQGRVATQLPYEVIADTLQRIIFHLAAIYSNQDSVLIFEEPEAHSFPDYIQLLATKIIESKSNQFFITTHSPYLVQKLLQGSDYHEIAFNVVGYKDHQTVMKTVSNEEMDRMIDRGSDVFFNLPKF